MPFKKASINGEILYQALDIMPNQKGINLQYPRVKKITGRINVFGTEIRSIGKTLTIIIPNAVS